MGLYRGRTEDRLAQMIVPFALETPPYPCPHGKMLPMHILTSHDASKCESIIISFKEMVNFDISSPCRIDAAAKAAENGRASWSERVGTDVENRGLGVSLKKTT